ncbi:hypothetical protein SODG_003922 [Sodalis praecaptivus]
MITELSSYRRQIGCHHNRQLPPGNIHRNSAARNDETTARTAPSRCMPLLITGLLLTSQIAQALAVPPIVARGSTVLHRAALARCAPSDRQLQRIPRAKATRPQRPPWAWDTPQSHPYFPAGQTGTACLLDLTFSLTRTKRKRGRHAPLQVNNPGEKSLMGSLYLVVTLQDA